jgi:hypothetical protein
MNSTLHFVSYLHFQCDLCSCHVAQWREIRELQGQLPFSWSMEPLERPHEFQLSLAKEDFKFNAAHFVSHDVRTAHRGISS